MRRLLDWLTRVAAWLRRRQLYRPSEPVKLNLGSGLSVAPGWIGIDSSLNALASRFPKPFLWFTYKLSSARRWYSFSEYVDLLKGREFIHHDLAHGIPLPDDSCEFIYSSHFVEHIEREDFERLLQESFRVLQPGGKIRLTTPSFEKLVAAYSNGNTEAIIETFFGKPGEGWYSHHRYIYDFALIKRLLEKSGFRDVVQLDSDEMDPRPSRYLLYVEATC